MDCDHLGLVFECGTGVTVFYFEWLKNNSIMSVLDV